MINTSTTLDSLVKNNNKVLYQLTTIFPFRVFPTQISIQPTKVDIVQNTFFGSHEVRNLLIKEISSVTLDATPFFATLKFKDRMPTQEVITVDFLNKDQAHEARRILEGLIVAATEGVDFSQLSTTEILGKVSAIGKTKV
jgi:cobalamin-dependent methionine synthase I